MSTRRGLPHGIDPAPDDLIARAWELRGRLDYRGAWALAERAAATLEVVGTQADPQLVAEGCLLVGQLAEDLGDPGEAESAYAKAASAAVLASAPTRSVLRVRSLTRMVALLRDQGAPSEAESALSEALAIAEEHLPGTLEQAELLAQQSGQRLDTGEHDEAELLANRAVEMANAAPASGAREETRTRTLGALGTVLRVRGRYSEAYPVLQDALTTAQAAFDPGSLETANALNDLGVCDKFSGQFERGIEHYRDSLRIYEATVGVEHPDVASLYHNLGGILHARRDFAAAEPWARRAVELRERLLDLDHLAVAADRAALASILSALGRYDEADGLLRSALAIFEKTYGPDNHHEIAVYLNDLAAIARRQGDLEEAERLHRRALAIKERLLGPDHAELAITLNNLAVVCRHRDRLDEAETLYRRAITILSRTVEPTHPALAASRDNLDRLSNQRHRADGTAAGATAPPAPPERSERSEP